MKDFETLLEGIFGRASRDAQIAISEAKSEAAAKVTLGNSRVRLVMAQGVEKVAEQALAEALVAYDNASARWGANKRRLANMLRLRLERFIWEMVTLDEDASPFSAQSHTVFRMALKEAGERLDQRITMHLTGLTAKRLSWVEQHPLARDILLLVLGAAVGQAGTAIFKALGWGS